MGDRVVSKERRKGIRRGFRVRRTIFEMLSHRKYAVTDKELNLTEEAFEDQFPHDTSSSENLTIMKSRMDSLVDKIFVFFPKGDSERKNKTNVSVFREFLGRMRKSEVRRAIVVLEQEMTPYSKKAIQYLNKMQDEYIIEYFTEDELLVNITKHQLVPKHEVLTDEEKIALLQKYKLKETQLPRIQTEDPISRYYGLQPGQVIKITRPSETAGRYVTYRLVL